MNHVHSNSKEKITKAIEGLLLLDSNITKSDKSLFLNIGILKLSDKLDDKQINQFLDIFGRMIANNQYDVDRVKNFLQVSIEVIEIIPVEYFLQWCEITDKVFSQTSKISYAFLKNSVGIIQILKYRHIDRWSSITKDFDGNEFSEDFLQKLEREINELKSLEKYERPKKIYFIEKFP